MLHGNPPDTTSLCPAVETARLLFMLQLVPLSFQPAMNLASRRRAFQLHPLFSTLRLARIWRFRCSLIAPLTCLSVPQGCLMMVVVSFHSAFPFPRKRQKEITNSRPTAHAAAGICNVSYTSLPATPKACLDITRSTHPIHPQHQERGVGNLGRVPNNLCTCNSAPARNACSSSVNARCKI